MNVYNTRSYNKIKMYEYKINAEDKNEWNSTSTALYNFMVCGEDFSHYVYKTPRIIYSYCYAAVLKSLSLSKT